MSSTLAFEPDEVLTAGNDAAFGQVDLVEEMRLRTWARKNYVSTVERDETWHAIILDEMSRIDAETSC
jgi:hypothetical protein